MKVPSCGPEPALPGNLGWAPPITDACRVPPRALTPHLGARQVTGREAFFGEHMPLGICYYYLEFQFNQSI